jgi:monovalent cation:H+ antiporter-2, CPA2 family
MNWQLFEEMLVLMGAAVAALVLSQRVRLPASLGYLLVGALVGPHALGLVSDVDAIHVLAEFGIVFLLFTIGLNFSLPQIHALRHLVLGPGTAQVALTTLLVGLAAWLLGLPPPAAFVVGAIFAQSSTTIISKQLLEQDEAASRHGRVALAMSVFQDVTAVPFVVVIPVLGAAAATALVAPLGWALLKAAAAFALLVLAGRLLLRPLFHLVAVCRSPELFTLTVLLISLAAAWTTQALGLSLALGAFLAGMSLGETEFRYHVDATIRPFRDVLLGLFFVTIGMLFNAAAFLTIWPWALLGALGLLSVKAILTAGVLQFARIDAPTAWRSGVILAGGGEFGFALLALGLEAGVLTPPVAQIALSAVLLSLVVAPLLIRANGRIAGWLLRGGEPRPADAPAHARIETQHLNDHVIICGFGRIGQRVGQFLEAEQVPYLALDLHPGRVRAAHAAGYPVYFGDATERETLAAVGIADARLLLVSFDQIAAALRLLHSVRAQWPDLPVMVRTRDETHVERLVAAGATEVVAETCEAATMIAAHVLMLADVPLAHVARRIRDQQSGRYRLLQELFRGEAPLSGAGAHPEPQVAATVVRQHEVPAGRTLAELDLDREQILTTAIIRQGEHRLVPLPQITLEPGDILVLYGAPADLQRAQARLGGYTEDGTTRLEVEVER